MNPIAPLTEEDELVINALVEEFRLASNSTIAVQEIMDGPRDSRYTHRCVTVAIAAFLGEYVGRTVLDEDHREALFSEMLELAKSQATMANAESFGAEGSERVH